jgi:hypothetical protein
LFKELFVKGFAQFVFTVLPFGGARECRTLAPIPSPRSEFFQGESRPPGAIFPARRARPEVALHLSDARPVDGVSELPKHGFSRVNTGFSAVEEVFSSAEERHSSAQGDSSFAKERSSSAQKGASSDQEDDSFARERRSCGQEEASCARSPFNFTSPKPNVKEGR